MTANLIIKCPHCGAEYLLEEIFYPEDIFGETSNGKYLTVKDENGRILSTESTKNLKQTYTCDYCDKDFEVTLNISNTTRPITDIFLEEDF